MRLHHTILSTFVHVGTLHNKVFVVVVIVVAVVVVVV